MPGFSYVIRIDRQHVDSHSDFDEAVYLLEEALAARSEAREGEIYVEEHWGGGYRFDPVCRLTRDGERLVVAYDAREPGARPLPYGPRGTRSRLSPLAG